MKRMTKRVLSVLCVVVMLFSCLSGLTFTVGAASGTSEFADKWTIYYSEEGMTLNYAKGERINVEFADFNACVPYCQQHNLKGKGTRAIVYPCLLFCDGFVKRYAQRAGGAAICRPRNVVCAAGGCKTSVSIAGGTDDTPVFDTRFSLVEDDACGVYLEGKHISGNIYFLMERKA